MYFGTFPRYFLLTTLLAIPLTTAVMYATSATVAAAGLSALFPILVPVATWTAEALRWLIHLLNTLLRLIASL